MVNLLHDYKKEIRFILVLFFSIYFTSAFFSLIIGIELPSIYEYNSRYISITTFMSILKNNLFVFLLLSLGTITFSVLTYINIATNAIMLGIGTSLFLQLQSLSIPFLIHGIPEFMGFFFAAALGLKPLNYHALHIKKSLFILLSGFLCVLIGSLLETFLSPIALLWLLT